MARLRAVVAAIVVIGGWVLNATSVVKGERWLFPIAASIAFAMLIWAEIDRHDAKENTRKRAEELQDQVSLNSSVHPTIRCFPSVIPEPLYEGGQLRIRLLMNREINMESGSAASSRTPTATLLALTISTRSSERAKTSKLHIRATSRARIVLHRVPT
jgi:hypothetical protein